MGKYETEDAGTKLDVTIELTLGGVDEWGNYQYNDAALTTGTLTVTKTDAGEITQKEITVTGISAENRVYDGTKTVTLTGEQPKTKDMVKDDDLTLTLAENATGTVQDSTAGANDAANVGTDKTVTVVATDVITLGGKDAGVRILMDALGLAPEECVAFGDGGNDVDMFGAVGTSVAMGNGGAEAKAAATYVTDHIDADGFWNACVRLGLL